MRRSYIFSARMPLLLLLRWERGRELGGIVKHGDAQVVDSWGARCFAWPATDVADAATDVDFPGGLALFLQDDANVWPFGAFWIFCQPSSTTDSASKVEHVDTLRPRLRERTYHGSLVPTVPINRRPTRPSLRPVGIDRELLPRAALAPESRQPDTRTRASCLSMAALPA